MGASLSLSSLGGYTPSATLTCRSMFLFQSRVCSPLWQRSATFVPTFSSHRSGRRCSSQRLSVSPWTSPPSTARTSSVSTSTGSGSARFPARTSPVGLFRGHLPRRGTSSFRSTWTARLVFPRSIGVFTARTRSWSGVLPSPASSRLGRHPPPNHALQRTEAGGTLFSAVELDFASLCR